jgi:hypothetical protein
MHGNGTAKSYGYAALCYDNIERSSEMAKRDGTVNSDSDISGSAALYYDK